MTQKMDQRRIFVFEGTAKAFLISSLPKYENVTVEISHVKVRKQQLTGYNNSTTNQTNRHLQESALVIQASIFGRVSPHIPPENFSFQKLVVAAFESDYRTFTDLLYNSDPFFHSLGHSQANIAKSTKFVSETSGGLKSKLLIIGGSIVAFTVLVTTVLVYVYFKKRNSKHHKINDDLKGKRNAQLNNVMDGVLDEATSISKIALADSVSVSELIYLTLENTITMSYLTLPFVF